MSDPAADASTPPVAAAVQAVKAMEDATTKRRPGSSKSSSVARGIGNAGGEGGDSAEYEWETGENEEGSDDENDVLIGNAGTTAGAGGQVRPEHLETSPETGLSETEAKARLRVYGYNELQEQKPNYFKIIFKYFSGPLEIMLLLAAALAGGLEEWVDFGVIFALLLLNAAVGFFQEYQAGSIISDLKATLTARQEVMRGGKMVEVEAREIVPGDIIELDEGDVIPADSRLVEDDAIVQIDQSTITGESMAVTKRGRDKDILYSSSTLKRGTALAVVIATGPNTFVGRAAMLAVNATPNVGFVDTLHSIGRFLMLCDFLAILVVFTSGYYRDLDFVQLLRYVLILTIVSIPVALPAVITTTMAVGARSLAKSKAIVSRLTAIETLAEVNILCSDKTGTLTLNKLTVHEPVPVGQQRVIDLMINAALSCNQRRKGREPIDKAIVQAIAKYPDAMTAVSKYTITDFKPFDPVSKIVTATAKHADTKETIIAAKGSVHQIEDLVAQDGGLSPETQKEYNKAVNDFASRGFRSLGVATKPANSKWQLLGVLPLFDPPRHDSAKTISEARHLGITVKMLTGDQLAIAKETGTRLGLGEHMFDMRKLEQEMTSMEGAEYVDLVEGADGFAGVFPEDKFRIVELLQGRSHIVAMTGDGVNDAPALKKSDVGIAVKGATDAARTASDILFLSSGLGVMINAIKLARQIFHRMNGYAQYRIALSFHLLIYLSFSIIIMKFQLNPTLVVFLAIFSDISSLAICADRSPYSMKPVRWNLRQLMTMSLAYAVILVAGTFVIHTTARTSGWAPEQHVVFLEVALTQNWLIFSARTQEPFFTSLPSPLLIITVIAMDLLASVFACLGWFNNGEGMTVVDALRIWIFAAGVFLLCDIVKQTLASHVFERVVYGHGDPTAERKAIEKKENAFVKLRKHATMHETR